MKNVEIIELNTNRGWPLHDHLLSLGYKIEKLKVADKVYNRIINTKNKTWLTPNVCILPNISPSVIALAKNKQLAYQFAEAFGLSVPKTLCVDKFNKEQIELFLRKYKKIVVKPLDSLASKGLTVNITNIEQANIAVKKALLVSRSAIIQEQIDAEEYRFTIIDGQVVSVLKRERPQVMGDGIHSVADLINIENKERQSFNLNKKDSYIFYPRLDKQTINDELLMDDTILSNGDIKILSNATMVSGGASVYEVVDEVHRSYKDKLENLIQQLGAESIVADVFIKDIKIPAKEQGYWFNELNTGFSLRIYYASRNKDSSFVAKKIIKKFDERLKAI